jgi:hypothetical protein
MLMGRGVGGARERFVSAFVSVWVWVLSRAAAGMGVFRSGGGDSGG